MARLVAEKGNDRGKTYRIEAKGSLVIGREPDADVQLRDTQCSRHHFRIEDRAADGWWLVDLGSMNGTLVNGKRVDKERKLIFGDLVKIGETVFSFLSDEPAAEESMIGMRIGGYEVIERVGRGGMGTVYKAEQIDLQRSVALKVIAAEHVKRKDFIELFVREARAAARLNHANIVQVYDVKKFSELYYFSMEFVPGGSVQDLLNRQRKVPVESAVSMILDAARGLEYAHKKDVIHRDVKPDNFMISETGAIKIGDLGLAQRLGEKLAADDEDTVIGTPHYIAPEQVLGKPADFRSDIYALGATMYRMVAGFTPHQAPSVRELVNKKVREDAVPLSQASAGVPQDVSDVCVRMMARKPEERYQTMTEVIIALERIQREMAGHVLRPADGIASRKLLAAAVILLAVVAVGGVVGAMTLFKRAPEATPPVANVPDPADTAEKGAYDALMIAKDYEARVMVRTKLEDLERSVREYAGVIERFPNTKAAGEAQGFLEPARRRLGDANAERAFAEIERADGENWQKMYASFRSEATDFAPVQKTIEEYVGFTTEEGTKGTPKARDAAARAEHIKAWLARVAEVQALFEKARTAAKAKSDEARFNEGWMLLDEFAKKALGRKMECAWAPDRYGSVLFEQAARDLMARIVAAAQTDFAAVEKAVDELERQRKYTEAIDTLNAAVSNFPEERGVKDPLFQKAADRQKKLELTGNAYRLEEVERREKAIAAAIAADAAAFEKLCRDARRDVLAVDFRSALARFKGAPAPGTDGYRARQERRAAELEALAEFKDIFRAAFNDVKNHPGLRRKSTFPGANGTIVSMSEKEFTIRADQDRGTVGLALKDVKPTAFYSFVKGATTWTDPKVIMGLALYCCEAGLYEEALVEIASLAPLSRDKAVVDFVDHYKARLEAGEFTEADELEAEKRFTRLKTFQSASVAGVSLEGAQRELELLRTRYKDTRFVTDRAGELKVIAEDLERRGGEELRRKGRAELHKRIMDHRERVRGEIAGRRDEILSRVGRIDDLMWKEARLGEFHMAYGELPKALERLWAAKVIGDRHLSDRTQARVYALVVGTVYQNIYRTCVMAGNKRGATEIRDEWGRKLNLSEWQMHIAPWWGDSVARLDLWEARFLEKREWPAMEKALKDTPDDPRRLWELAEAHFAVRNYVEARACVSALIAVHPGAPPVGNGDAQLLLADVLTGFHELPVAVALYRAVESKFPNHPRVKAGPGPDAVRSRIDFLLLLMQRMGLKPEDAGGK